MSYILQQSNHILMLLKYVALCSLTYTSGHVSSITTINTNNRMLRITIKQKKIDEEILKY